MVTLKNVEKILYSSGGERELLCEAITGKSFKAAWPELAYELLIGKLSVKEWMVIAIDYNCMHDQEKLSIQLRDRKTGNVWHTDVYKWQADQRFVDVMSEFAALQIGPTGDFRKNKDIANTAIMTIVNNFMKKE